MTLFHRKVSEYYSLNALLDYPVNIWVIQDIEHFSFFGTSCHMCVISSKKIATIENASKVSTFHIYQIKQDHLPII